MAEQKLSMHMAVVVESTAAVAQSGLTRAHCLNLPAHSAHTQHTHTAYTLTTIMAMMAQ